MESRWRKVIYIFGKSSFFDLEPLVMIISGFISFLTPIDSSHSEVFVDVWLSLDKSNHELPLVYKIINKSISALIRFKVCNHDFDLNLAQLHKICSHIPKHEFSLSVSPTSLFCDMQINEKWYLMHMCISWLCPFKQLTLFLT